MVVPESSLISLLSLSIIDSGIHEEVCTLVLLLGSEHAFSVPHCCRRFPSPSTSSAARRTRVRRVDGDLAGTECANVGVVELEPVRRVVRRTDRDRVVSSRRLQAVVINNWGGNETPTSEE